MIEEREHCNKQQLSRYIDSETDPQEVQRIERHLQHCADCLRYVQQQRELAQQLRREVTAAQQAVDFDRLEKQITSAADKQAKWSSWLPESWFSWKVVLPAAATAALALFIFTPWFQPPPPSGPSALIKSFTGKVSSVMILETPKSQRTVIWYSEETTENNEV